VISDEAVEEAARAAAAFFEGKPPRGTRAAIRQALEAAAPYIAAEAWDRAASSIVDEHGNQIIPDSNTNPYRSQA
jgi:hypothetical protein